MAQMPEGLTIHIILRVCDRNGSHRFSRYQVMKEVVAWALEPDSGIENPSSAERTAGHQLKGLVTCGLIRQLGGGEYEFFDQDYLNAWISTMKMKRNIKASN